jgi:hypothetical protein
VLPRFVFNSSPQVAILPQLSEQQDCRHCHHSQLSTFNGSVMKRIFFLNQFFAIFSE